MSEIDANISPLNYEKVYKWVEINSGVEWDGIDKHIGYVSRDTLVTDFCKYISQYTSGHSPFPLGCYYLQAGDVFRGGPTPPTNDPNIGALNARGSISIKLNLNPNRALITDGSTNKFIGAAWSPGSDLKLLVVKPVKFPVNIEKVGIGPFIQMFPDDVNQLRGSFTTLYEETIIASGTPLYQNSKHEFNLEFFERDINAGVLIALIGGKIQSSSNQYGLTNCWEVRVKTHSTGFIQGQNFTAAGYSMSVAYPKCAIGSGTYKYNQFFLPIPIWDTPPDVDGRVEFDRSEKESFPYVNTSGDGLYQLMANMGKAPVMGHILGDRYVAFLNTLRP